MRKYHRHYKGAKKRNPGHNKAAELRKVMHSHRRCNPDENDEAARRFLAMFPTDNPIRVRNQQVGITEALEGAVGFDPEEERWQALAGSVQLPQDATKAFNFGVRFGLLTGIEMCDINPFSKTSQLRRSIYDRLNRSFSDEQRAFSQSLIRRIEKGQDVGTATRSRRRRSI